MNSVQPNNRPAEITQSFLIEVDKHLSDIVAGRVYEMHEIETFADLLFIHPTHLSNTIKEYTGKSPCHFYQEKIMDAAKNLLSTSNHSVKDIALMLTYDPSNFNKVFKKFIGVTPGEYRKRKLQLLSNR